MLRHTHAAPRRARPGLPALAPLLGLLLTQFAWAQGRANVMEKVTLVTADGREIPRSTVVWTGGKITAVGPKASGGFLSRKIDAAGKYVTPGLIDVWAMNPLAQIPAGGLASGRAADLIDLYAHADRELAWRHGIIAAYVPAAAASGAAGQGAIVRFATPDDEESSILSDSAALCFVIGARDENPLVRVQQLQAMRTAFREARDWQHAREDYEDDLKEYEKKLAEAAKSQPQSQPASSNVQSRESTRPGRRGGSRNPGDDKPAPARQGQAQARGKQEGPKKPVEPPRDPNKAALVRALDGEQRVRVWVERPEDILNVLRIADEFGLAVVLEGASGAHLVADAIKAANAAVVLHASARDMQFDAGSRRFDRLDNATKLENAGVRVFLASGPTAGSDLALAASRWVGLGMNARTAWRRITGEAAEFLGISKKIGQLEQGDSADFVVWSAHPFSPGARVERVYVAGKEVFNAESAQERK